jgi:hypothetical protein
LQPLCPAAHRRYEELLAHCNRRASWSLLPAALLQVGAFSWLQVSKPGTAAALFGCRDVAASQDTWHGCPLVPMLVSLATMRCRQEAA